MAVTGEGSGQQQVPDKPDSEEAPQNVEGQYTVKSGDTLNKVAARIDVSWEDLAAWNDISYPYTIFPGQVLLLSGEETDSEPEVTSDATYTVQRGDHLLKIARELELDWTVLADLNQLLPPYLLYPGMVLHLPASAEAAGEPDAPEVPETYTALRSESLFALAHYYQLDWIKIAGLNNLAFPYALSAGQTIRLK
jgi:LysM repeat protein